MYSVNYQQKDYNTIFEEYLRKAIANGLLYGDEEQIQQVLHGEGIENVMIMELAIHSEMLTETYKELANINDSFNILKAKGTDLDRLLEPFVKRRNATYATTTICFQKSPHNTSPIQIPAGTQITSTTHPQITFETLENATLQTGTEKILITSICLQKGSMGNIPAGKLDKILTPINGIIKVYNPTAATGGREKENDTSYRLRGQGWTSINTQGTLMAFQNAIKNISSVEDYYIQRHWDGPGTTRIIINPPSTEVLEQVKEAIHDVCAVDEEYTVIGAENKPINIDINLTIQNNNENLTGTLEKTETNRQVKEALKTYIEGSYEPTKGKTGGLQLGEDFIPSRAAAHIINTLTTVKDVQITYPLSIVSIDYYQKAICGEVQIETP